MKIKKSVVVINIVGLLVLIQLLRIALKQVFFIFVEKTNYSDHMASLIAMILLTVLFILFAHKQKVNLSIFPNRFTISYKIATVIALLLLISTPFITGDKTIQTIVCLLYSSVVTPIFEELIFRGYIWNKIEVICSSKWKIYISSTILFALWHIGYIDAIAFRVEVGVPNAMFWKVITGFCFGIVLGGLRLKTKNSYSTILMHCVMNIFGR